MIDRTMGEDAIRRKIEALATTLTLPTVRRALGVIEGEHPSHRRFGSDDIMDIRPYEAGDEARRIDYQRTFRKADGGATTASSHLPGVDAAGYR